MEQFYTPREEWWNRFTHGIGVLLAAAGCYQMVVSASLYGTAVHVVSAGIYGACLIALFLASTCYHSSYGRYRPILKTIDHICIYFLIGGTYTPLALVILQSGWRWTMFGLIWGFALVGIVFKLFGGERFRKVSTITYLLMGWLAAIAIKPLMDGMAYEGFMLILIGGVIYSIGALFYAIKRPYFHAIFHLFVLLACVLHYTAIYYFVIPG